MVRASIRRLNRLEIQLPAERSPYNDDVKVEAYRPPFLSYAGNRRKGIRENFDACEAFREHVGKSPGAPFALAVETPLPHDVISAVLLSRGCQPGKLRSFWKTNLGRIGKLFQESSMGRRKWGDCIPGGIRPEAGKIQTVAISHLMGLCGL